MTLNEFKSWVEGYVAGVGVENVDFSVVYEKLNTVQETPSYLNKPVYRTPDIYQPYTICNNQE